MNLKKFTWIAAVAVALVVSAFAVPANVQAASLDGAKADTHLENLLMREKIALNNQAARLDKARQTAAKAQTWIDNQKAKGKDTSTLTAGLADFNQGIISAQADHDQAAGILASPAGFDASGKVTDAAQALKTVSSAGLDLRQAHLTITQAVLNYRAIVKTYRDAHKSQA
jgi:hypothetical protein